MLNKIKKSLNEGAKSVKWIASFLAERTRAETNMAKLLYASSKLEAKLDEHYIDIGKRVLELKGQTEKMVIKDFIILQMISEIERIRAEIADLKQGARELGNPTELRTEEQESE